MSGSGWRLLAKTRVFSVTAVAVLALGIGMNTAMFSAVKAVLLSALPYPQPERLVQIWQTSKSGRLMTVSGLDFRDWRAQNRSLTYMASYGFSEEALAGEFRPRRIRAGQVSADFFATMGTAAAIGRTFSRAEQRPGGTPTLLLGYELSQATFGDAARAIGRSVRIDGMAFTVIGVMPPAFDFPNRSQAWMPGEFFPDDSTRSAHNYHVVGRLKDSASMHEAQSDMDVIAGRLARAYIDDKDDGIRLVPLYDEIVGPVRPAFLILLSAVTLVLLIACVNVSNLQMARATVRLKELALRKALGAGRGRLIRQLLTESILLAMAGGTAGLLLGVGGVAVLRHTAPANIPRLESIRVDATILFFTAALSMGAGVLFGVLPALSGSRSNANDALKEGSGKSTAGLQLKRWGNALVVGEVALAIVLLAGAMLLLKSYSKLAHVPSGLRSEGVYTADLSWPTADGNSANGKVITKLSGDLLERVSRLPGVEACALTGSLPVRDGGSNGDFEIEGKPLPADPHQNPDAFYQLATRQYFDAFGLPILKGRGFDARDEASTQQVAVVNRSFAQKFFPAQEVIGKRIRFFGFDRKPQFMTIIGLVPDVHAFGLNRPTEAQVFAEYMQHTDLWWGATLVVRGAFAEQAQIRSIVSSLNPDTPVEFQSMDDVIAGTIARERFQTFLLSLFAGCALLLSAVGIYGLLSYTVTRRTSELGIRMALGADRKAVLGIVLSEGGKLVIAGTVVGMGCAFFLTRTLSSLLFGVKANDAGSFATVAVVFAAVALLGCYLPARRAAKIDPTVALRYE